MIAWLYARHMKSSVLCEFIIADLGNYQKNKKVENDNLVTGVK
jgi:hypothetical protein